MWWWLPCGTDIACRPAVGGEGQGKKSTAFHGSRCSKTERFSISLFFRFESIQPKRAGQLTTWTLRLMVWKSRLLHDSVFPRGILTSTSLLPPGITRTSRTTGHMALMANGVHGDLFFPHLPHPQESFRPRQPSYR